MDGVQDQLTYTFKIRKGVKFHDGSELTAKDIKASYDKILHPPAGVKSLRKEAYESDRRRRARPTRRPSWSS